MGVGSGVIQDLTQMLNCGGGNCNCAEINARLSKLENQLNSKVEKAELNPAILLVAGTLVEQQIVAVTARLTQLIQLSIDGLGAGLDGKIKGALNQLDFLKRDLESGIAEAKNLAGKAMNKASMAESAANSASNLANTANQTATGAAGLAGSALGKALDAVARIAAIAGLLASIFNTIMILQAVFPRLDGHDKEIAALGAQISGLYTAIGSLKSELLNAISRLQSLLDQARQVADLALNTAREAAAKAVNALNLIAELNSTISNMSNAISQLQRDVSSLITLPSKIAALESIINDLKGKINDAINKATDATNKATNALNKVTSLESIINDLKNKITDALNKVASLESIINDLKGKFSELNSKINDALSKATNALNEAKNALNEVNQLAPQVTNNTNTINNLKPQVANNTNTINNLKPQVTNNTTAINNLKPQVNTNTNSINQLKQSQPSFSVTSTVTNQQQQQQQQINQQQQQIEELKQNKAEKTDLDCKQLSQTLSKCQLNPNDLKNKQGGDVQYSNISVKVFKQCNPDTKEPEFESKSIQVIKGTENQEIFNFERLFNIESQQCKVTEPMAVVPEWWQTRPGQRSQLVILYADILDNGKLGKSRWSISIPHYNRDQNYKPHFPSYFKGDTEGIMRLADNTKVIVNCKDATECKRVLNVFKQFIDQKMIADVNIKIGERFGNSYKKVRVVPVRCSFFSDGQKDMLPTWFLDLKKKK